MLCRSWLNRRSTDDHHRTSAAELAELAADIADLTERVEQLETDVAALVAEETQTS